MGEKDKPMQDADPSGDQKNNLVLIPNRGGNVASAKNMPETEPSQDESVKTKGVSILDVNCSVDSSEKLDQRSATMVLAEMFIVDELPFGLVKCKRFRNFVSAMNPRFQLPSCITLVKDCSRIHLDEKLKLKRLLSSVGSRISLSAKKWTSLQNLSYLCITAHFVDDDWKLHRKILNFCPIAGGKGEEIGRIVESSVLHWGIQNVGTLTVENSVQNDVAVKYLKEKFHIQDYLLFGGEFFHIRCSADFLNLIVKDCLDEMQTSVSRIRDAIKYVRSSTSAAEKFKRCIMRDQITPRSSIRLDVETRWTSTYFMLNSALDFQRAFGMLEEDDPEFLEHLDDEAPTNADWNNARVLVKFLNLFFDISKILAGSNFTSNLYFMDVCNILFTLDEWTESSELHLQSMALKVKESFKKYLGSIDESNLLLLLVSMAFDPRCNVHGVRFFLAVVYPDESEKVDSLVTQVTDMMKKFFDYYKKLYLASLYESDKDQDDSQDEDDIHWEFEKYMEKEDRARRELELQRYLVEYYEVVNDNFDILSWWNTNSNRTYRVLPMIARNLLSIPVSSMDSKCAGSFEDHTLGQFHSSLPPMTLESLICTKSWLETSPPQVEFEEDSEELEKLEFAEIEEKRGRLWTTMEADVEAAKKLCRRFGDELSRDEIKEDIAKIKSCEEFPRKNEV